MYPKQKNFELESGPGEWTKWASRLRACLRLRTLAILTIFFTGHAQGTQTGRPTRILTTTHQAHSISAAEAVKGHAVDITGVITLYDPHVDPRQIIFFLHDSSGSIFFALPHGTPPAPAGTKVRLRGVTGMGDFAPVIKQPSLQIVGKGNPLPKVEHPVSLTHLLTGQEDGQWVEVEGVIHSVIETEHNAALKIAMSDGTLIGKLPKLSGWNYSNLVDSKVRTRGHAVPVFNGDGQMIGVQLMVPSRDAIDVIEPGPANVFQLPISTIQSLSRFGSVTALPRRMHVRGTVTLSWPGSLLCIRDANHGLCAHTLQATPVSLGDTVDLVGFTEIMDSVPSFTDAVFQKAPERSAAVQSGNAERVTAEQALNGNYGSGLVELEGHLIGRDLTAANTTLIVSSDGKVFTVVLPKDRTDAIADQWQNGSTVRVTGICSVKIDAERGAREGGAAKRESFRILLRSSSDVVVLQKPSWWTPKHATIVLAVVLAAVSIVLGWVVVLSKRLRQQKETIAQSELRFRYMAQHDNLTGLPTRALLRERLDAAVEEAKHSTFGIALLMLDLDKFKQINDTLGHQAGDEALKVAAQRLQKVMLPDSTVARISGDEFVVLIPNLSTPEEADRRAASVVAALSVPFRFGDCDVPLSTSVGVCAAFGCDLRADTLLKQADLAMYHAKARGRNCYQQYTVDMACESEHQLLLRTALGRALEQNEIEVHYQPMVDFKTRELTGFEALMRWRSNDLGMIYPVDFISLAEETGLILGLGEWILRQACREVGALERELGRSFLLSVNLSPKQIQTEHAWPQTVARVLSETGRSPHLLELEITESILMDSSSRTRSALTELRALGVRLAIDDFGVGFSSLSYITQFAIDRLKIDRSFVQKCLHEEGSLAVVRAIIAMAHGLSLEVVAEGVETAAEFELLLKEGCDTAQGYFLSRPMPLAELPRLVEQLRQKTEHSTVSHASLPDIVPAGYRLVTA